MKYVIVLSKSNVYEEQVCAHPDGFINVAGNIYKNKKEALKALKYFKATFPLDKYRIMILSNLK